MKKKIIIGLSVFSLIFFLGGIYIIVTIEKTTEKFDRLIELHQVEILREHLLIQIKRVQTDLTLKDTRFARDADVIVRNVRNLHNVLDTCFSCHHTDAVMTRLDELKKQTGHIRRRIKQAHDHKVQFRETGGGRRKRLQDRGDTDQYGQ